MTESRDRSSLDELRSVREQTLHRYRRTEPPLVVLCPITIEPMPEEMPFEERLRRTYAYAQTHGPIVAPRATIHARASERPSPHARAAVSTIEGPPDEGDEDDDERERPATGLASLLLAIALAVVAIMWEFRQPEPPARHRASEQCNMVVLASQGTFERGC
jgi:hypothetical protein